MYLSVNNCFVLDRIVKGFEVAYRSIVCEVIINRCPNESTFLKELTELKIVTNKNSIASSEKYLAKLQSLINNYKDVYKAIQECNKCEIQRDYSQNEVLYVSQIIDLVVLLFNPSFKQLSSNFNTVEQFIYYSVNYQRTRNSLSHPASSKILIDESKEVVTYVKKIMDVIDDHYFWYVSKVNIYKDIEEFVRNLNNNPISKHNLNEISFQHKKLIYREKELESMKELIIGKGDYYRKSGSLVVYGYGGVGKTALVLEFIYEFIKDIIDNKVKDKIDFILFFTSKEEVLNYSQTTGDLYIDKIRKQIKTFNDYKENLFYYLNVNYIKQLNNKRGIVIIDNIETLKDEDKNEVIDFIKASPRTIQYIITSRNEERCEDKLYVHEFNENNNGEQFVEKYITENNLNINLTREQRKELVASSKGNTLILVLALERINDGKTSINAIISELNNVASKNAEMIANFMYKNTFDILIRELVEKGYSVIELLRVISLYDEPVDIYSISVLSDISIKSVEFMCGLLSTKLVLTKVEELYTLNEFANKFIFSKLMPDMIEYNKIRKKIDAYKANLKVKLDRLENKKKESKLLIDILEDWKPRNYIDKIAIAEAFNLYSDALAIKRLKDINEVNEGINKIERQFKTHEVRTSHPYVRYQKARIYQLFLPKARNKEEIKNTIISCYEETILSVQFDYKYIRNTKSFASVLWIYGIFLNGKVNDIPNAIKYLEESKEIFESIKIQDPSYIKMLSELCNCYTKIYNQSKNIEYYNLAVKMLSIIKSKRNLNIDFDFSTCIKIHERLLGS